MFKEVVDPIVETIKGFKTQYLDILKCKKDELLNLRDIAFKLDESWSQSWIGFHSNLYFSGFQKPPSIKYRFDSEWGSINGIPEYWEERSYEDVVLYVEDNSGRLSLVKIQEEITPIVAEIKKIQTKILTDLPVFLDDDKFTNEMDLLEKIKEHRWGTTVQDLIKVRMPKNFVTRDSFAMQQGIRTPPHIMYQNEVFVELSKVQSIDEFLEITEILFRRVELISRLTDQKYHEVREMSQGDRYRDNIPAITETKKCFAVIFTALPVEYKAVRSHLKFLEEKVHPQGTIYEQGIFSSSGQSWNVGIAEIGEGNEQTALEVERAIQYFNPRIILFVGVAGGVKDVKIGDVVVATKVYGYESGKAGNTFEPRPQLGLPDYGLINRAKAEARKDDWLQRLGERAPSPYPKVFVKPIAAGNKVLSSTRSAVCKLIKSNYGDTLAVEMEGYGFLKAAYANSRVTALLIRGISDLLNKKEEADKAGSQETASINASAFAFEVLAKSYIEPVDLE